jgi:hypothetical protein
MSIYDEDEDDNLNIEHNYKKGMIIQIILYIIMILIMTVIMIIIKSIK